MANMLFVTTAIPFPPRNGVELPLSKVIERLSLSHTVDLLVTTGQERYQMDFAKRRDAVPPNVSDVSFLRADNRSRATAVLKELLGIRPSFMLAFDRSQVIERFRSTNYDFAWCSPIGCLGLAEECTRNRVPFAHHVALGHNDPEVALYWDSFRQLFTGHVRIELGRIIKGLRIPWMYLYERRYLRKLDMIHVQTDLEQRRMRAVLGRQGRMVEVVPAPNGRNLSLDSVSYDGIDSGRVLYMTHLEGGRRRESEWFLRDVWSRISAAVPSAELWLVGTPPRNREFESSLPGNVRVCGFVESLPELFTSVAVSVVPTHHGTGWINRVVDSLAAGVPIVACTEPLRTIPNLEIGTHALKGDSTKEFAENVIRLLSDRELRARVAAMAKHFGRGLPMWQDTTNRISSVINALLNDGSSSAPGEIPGHGI